jgi:two-component system chemotaxis sensor kinase CheA
MTETASLGSGRIRAAFKAEAAELLCDLDGALLEMEADPGDAEAMGLLQRLMRALRGSSEIQGFDQVARLAQFAERLLASPQKGKWAQGPPLSRKSVGLLKAILTAQAALIHKGDASPAAEAARLIDLLEALRAMAANLPTAHEPKAAAHDPAVHRFTFRVSRDAFERGPDPLGQLAHFRELGRCSVVAQTGEVPPLEDLRPERCYLSWRITMDGSAGRQGRQPDAPRHKALGPFNVTGRGGTKTAPLSPGGWGRWPDHM